MENRRILNWRARSLVFKTAAISGLIGALLPLGITAAGKLTGPHEAFDLLSILWELIFAVPAAILRSVGFNPITYRGEDGTSWVMFFLLIAVNAVVFFVLGGVIGCFLKIRRARR